MVYKIIIKLHQSRDLFEIDMYIPDTFLIFCLMIDN